jgi:hypothetical protein
MAMNSANLIDTLAACFKPHLLWESLYVSSVAETHLHVKQNRLRLSKCQNQIGLKVKCQKNIGLKVHNCQIQKVSKYENARGKLLPKYDNAQSTFV